MYFGFSRQQLRKAYLASDKLQKNVNDRRRVALGAFSQLLYMCSFVVWLAIACRLPASFIISYMLISTSFS